MDLHFCHAFFNIPGVYTVFDQYIAAEVVFHHFYGVLEGFVITGGLLLFALQEQKNRKAVAASGKRILAYIDFAEAIKKGSLQGCIYRRQNLPRCAAFSRPKCISGQIKLPRAENVLSYRCCT